MFKNIDISHDRSTWPSSRVPSSIRRLPATRTTNIWSGLIHTAIRTRPPSRYGFHLSDLYAWFRYFHAFASSSDFRLRPEWQEIDPHQKMVLSDELGIGFTTQLLAEELSVKDFVDTIHYLKVVNPTAFRYLRRASRGPGKTPDFVGIDNRSRFYIIECKGTQSSRSALYRSMRKGIAQKNNIVSNTGTLIHAALVLGLFIPQSSNKQNALIHIMDPEPSKYERLFHNVSIEILIRGLQQISLAKQFELLGLQSIARTLASTKTAELGEISNSDKKIVSVLTERESYKFTYQSFDSGLSERRDDENTVIPKIFEVRVVPKIFQDLLEHQTYNKFIDGVFYASIEKQWVTSKSNSSITITSPQGFEYTLST